jgi:hypothetical protein
MDDSDIVGFDCGSKIISPSFYLSRTSLENESLGRSESGRDFL